ncbi:nitrite transporter NirC [Ferrovum sp. JA12]|uniref:nitrite transporter NirC n=1 Tax=Ferrovum sp. JA12 TaxID=1356299 RepID=UPI0007037366|nr:nitrite transporter NirC [Ferrovum sp. JA12]KRH78805.1 nitrite transporter NirC [Ferrovum sp. JA12]
MYVDTIQKFSVTAEEKATAVRTSLTKFFVATMMAGAYVGLAIILIFSVGAKVEPAYQRLVMGASFGVALTLVVFAGSELYTGHTMIMPIGWLCRRVRLGDVGRVLITGWFGNLAGALLLALIFVAGGGGAVLAEGAPLLFKVASAKMNAPALELVMRGILCNWLVCLALWMANRTSSDAAKLIMIFWCLFAFIASGYEHSIANMTIFFIAFLSPHPDTVSLAGMIHNLFWVTLGNTISGALFMATAYWFVTGPKTAIDTREVEKLMVASDLKS